MERSHPMFCMFLGKVSKDVQKKFENGCSRCRFRAFCTRSCWVKRGWRVWNIFSPYLIWFVCFSRNNLAGPFLYQFVYELGNVLHVHFALALRQMSTFHCRQTKCLHVFFWYCWWHIVFYFAYFHICLFCMAFAGMLLECILICSCVFFL